jgi:YesN/AraC family two-component response regulator
MPSRSGIITSGVLTKLGFHVEGEAETAAQGLKLFRELKPKLVMSDDFPRERRVIYYQR